MTLDKRAHALAHDQVVVREKNVDDAFSMRGFSPHALFVAYVTPGRQ